jgi:carboxypeptidase T
MKKLLFILFIIPFTLISQTKIEKYHRAKITYNSIENLKKLDKLGIAIDHGIHKKGYFIISDFSETEIQLAKNIGLNVEIEIEDVSNYYANQNKNPQTFSPENTSCLNSATDYITPSNYSNG